MINDTTQENQTEDLVYAVAASSGSGVCFAARQTGLYRSDDGGTSWQPAFTSLELEATPPAVSVVLSPNFAEDQTLFVGVPGGIIRSYNGGDAWNIVALPAPPPFVSSMTVSPNYTKDGIIFAGTMEDGILRSGDRGTTWQSWNFGLLDLNTLCVAISPGFASDETVIVGTESGIFFSKNSGRAWRETAFPTEHAPVLSLFATTNSSGESLLLAGTESHGLFVSADYGKSWNAVSSLDASGPINSIIGDQNTILLLINDTIFISQDSGSTWTQRPMDQTPDSVICVAAPAGITPQAPLLLGCADGSIIRID